MLNRLSFRAIYSSFLQLGLDIIPRTMTRNELDEELNECCATYHHPFGKDAEPGDEGFL